MIMKQEFKGKKVQVPKILATTTGYKVLISMYRNSDKENYARSIAGRERVTYAHTVKVLSRMEDHALLTSRREGRKKLFELTEEGEEVAERMESLVSKFNQVIEKQKDEGEEDSCE